MREEHRRLILRSWHPPVRQSEGMPALEIAVASPTGARTAQHGGADRVELCAALELGGVTPSQGLIEAAVETGVAVHVLVRPRPGDFVYDADELALTERELRAAIRSGAAGVVVGALTRDGRIDRPAVARLAALARAEHPAIRVTVHRALDHSSDPVLALADLAGLPAESRIDRVLTSGGASRAGLGLETLRRLVDSGSGIEVMAGGGVTIADIPLLVGVGVHAVHLSAKRTVTAAPTSGTRPALGAQDAAAHSVTDAAIVAEARATLDAAVRLQG